ncbi:MAG TPA: FAD-dependent oxidoreductase [Rhodothermales bacterium]|nr:FAD-dependent oxidoreductase [Rhodothermales bacterium]
MAIHVVIIGNGITGVTAARFIRKLSDYRITLISAETDHFYSRTALMYIYMGHMTYHDTKPYEDWFWEKNDITLMRDFVTEIDTENQQVRCASGNAVPYDALLLATGSASNKFGWPGQDLAGVQGLYGMPDLNLMERMANGISRAVVVGGGLIGVEMSEMLHARNIPVTFLVRETSYMDYLLPPEESSMVNREILEHGIDLRLNTELEAILPDESGRVRAVTTKDREEIPCQFVGLTVGVHPNIEVVKQSEIETNRGVLVNEYLETNIPNVYAAGDCAEFRDPSIGSKPIEQLWYTGRKQGKTVAYTICGERRAYDRGVFFNSAKFYNIEYQTYGEVPVTPGDDEATLYWEHMDGKRSIRLTYKKGGPIVGFVLMGIRYRQEVCEAWIRNGTPIRQVLENLGAANCDPEFFEQFEADLIAHYNRQHPENPIRLRRKRGRRFNLKSILAR